MQDWDRDHTIMSPINTTQWSHAGTGLAGLNICRIRLQKRSVLKCIYTMQFTAYIFNGYEYVYMHAWVSIVYTRVALMIISPIFTLILSKILIPGPQDFLLNLLNPGRCRETSIWWSAWVETLYFLHSESSFNKKLIQSHKQ